jgi:hypothetical protein
MMDLFQAFVQRTIVTAHDQTTWMVCYALQGTDDDRRQGRKFYLAVPCSPSGALPCLPYQVSLICVTEAPTPEQGHGADPTEDPEIKCKRCGRARSHACHRPSFGYHPFEAP